jgi:hypothetical protein
VEAARVHLDGTVRGQAQTVRPPSKAPRRRAIISSRAAAQKSDTIDPSALLLLPNTFSVRTKRSPRG